jgi:GH15 family glucan-1,4-alpha-glucosidase
VPWLPGYRGAGPVRIGNAAADQLQLDVFGELVDATYQARKHFLAPIASAWAQQQTLIEHLEDIWELPDQGIWEVRGGRRQFTFSKVMAWVALDRSVRDAERFRLDAPWTAGDKSATASTPRSANAGSTGVETPSHRALAAANSMRACY